MSNPLALPADWGYQVASRLLAAGVSCDFKCSRSFVVDGLQMPEHCCDPCQFFATVTERSRPADCGFEHVAHVRLYVDTCKTEIQQMAEGELGPGEVSKAAQAASSARGNILKGVENLLMGVLVDDEDFGASLVDPIRLTSRNVEGGPWAPISEGGTCARWQIEFIVTL